MCARRADVGLCRCVCLGGPRNAPGVEILRPPRVLRACTHKSAMSVVVAEVELHWSSLHEISTDGFTSDRVEPAAGPAMSASHPKRPSAMKMRSVAKDESPGGISPPGAPKTVREPLNSHGSRCSTVGKRAAGFTSSTGSSCRQLASVGRWSRLNNAAPSVQLHYRAFVPTTSHSAPVLRIGTLVLAVLAACDFSLYIGAQVLTFRTKAWLSFAPPPCRMPLGPSQASPKLIPKEWPPPGFGIA